MGRRLPVMTDIFISYARSTASQARQLADALRELGYEVWRDDELPAHRPYAEVIEERLAAARAVVVIWSAEAVKSEWVRSEADRARNERKLVQLTIDGATPPMPFDQIQCADLGNWRGDTDAPGWRKVTDSIKALVGAIAPAATLTVAPQRGVQPLLAVLPFDNLSADLELGYLSDGISEEILDTVARGSDVKVIARTSSFQFRGSDKSVRRIVAELKASHLLDGSVRQAGSRVRISAQLVDCATETPLWSDRFDRDLSDIFALQDEIAAAVAGALKRTFQARSEGRVEPAAFEAYRKGREVRHQAGAGSYAGVRASADLFQQAVDIDPNFARARGQLALDLANLARAGAADEPAALARKARSEAEAAIAMDPGLATPWVALSVLEPNAAYQRVEMLLERALQACPSDAQALAQRSRFLAVVGRFREAEPIAAEAVARDPLDAVAATYQGTLIYGLHGARAAVSFWDDAVDKWPTVVPVIVSAMNVAAVAHDLERARSLVSLARQHKLDGSAHVRNAIAFAEWTMTGDDSAPDALITTAERQLAEYGSARVDTLFFLCAYGRRDAAYGFVERSSFEHMRDPMGALQAGAYNPGMLFLRLDQGALIDDPRFVGLSAKLGLLDYWTATGHWPDAADDPTLSYNLRGEARRFVEAPGG